MSEIALVMTEKVNNTLVNGYWIEGKVWFTREQIGMALEYKFPDISVAKIHKRHPERLNLFSMVSQIDYPSGKQMTYLYDERGVFEICRWSRQPKANMVMDRLYDMAIQIMHDQWFCEYEQKSHPGKKQSVEGRETVYLPTPKELRESREDRSFCLFSAKRGEPREVVIAGLREIWEGDSKGFEWALGEYNLSIGLTRKGNKTKAQKERERREKQMNKIIMR